MVARCTTDPLVRALCGASVAHAQQALTLLKLPFLRAILWPRVWHSWSICTVYTPHATATALALSTGVDRMRGQV